MKTTIINITGLTCTACQKLITKRIKTIADVHEVDVSLSGKTNILATRIIAAEEVQAVLAGTHYAVGGIL